MLFNSYEFIFGFLPIVLIGCLILAKYFQGKYVVAWLVVSSFFFYAWWNPPFFFLIFISILSNYIFAGYLLSHHKKWVLWVGLSFNLGVLIYYKYIGFFAGIFETSHGKDFFDFNTILPLGISFFTFQQIAFLVDVYRERFKYNFINHCMFIVFFPHLIAGPIVLHHELVPQFADKKISIRSRNLAIGICYFTLGLIKKVIIADRLSLYATPVFEAAAFEPISFFVSWCGVLAYSFQLYFDFSGYSDMAIGLGQMFGIKFPLNFNSPYKATSIIDFWRRWHMTLSRFLRDYLYIPLGGGRVGTFRKYCNLMVVMLLGGLWHGAGITFVLWGGLHGMYLIINHLWRYLIKKFKVNDTAAYYRFLSWTLTFLAVTVAWCFFRAGSLKAAMNLLYGLVGLDGRMIIPTAYEPYFGTEVIAYFKSLGAQVAPIGENDYYYGKIEIFWLMAALSIILFLPNSQEFMTKYSPALGFQERRNSKLLVWRMNYRYAAIFGTLFAVSVIMLSGHSEFLYFRF